MALQKVCILIVGTFLYSQSLFAQETFGINIDSQIWAEGLKTVREVLSDKRSGNASEINNDHYDLEWIELIQPELIEFQTYAIWIDLSIGAPFKDPERGLKSVLERLQSETSIKKTETFLEEYCYTLSDSQFECGVDSNFIGGIISIESFFGTYDGVFKFPTFATLISWVALQNKEFRQHVLDQYFTAIDIENYFKDNQTDKVFPSKKYDFSAGSLWENRALKRAKKSVPQLRDFLNIAQSMQWPYDSLIKVQGSWVGAFTDGQFMPVTLRGILKPGETIDPHRLRDVIPLIARYLSKFWGESDAERDRAIKYYNSPTWYRNHVKTVANLVEQRWNELLKESENE